MKYTVVVINFRLVLKLSNVTESGSSVLMGRASPGCEKKGGAPTAEWGLFLLLPN
jgi:hypothetical protein